MSLGKCNCGREVRYSHFKDGEMVMSCNKYQVCPAYDELESQLKDLRAKYRELKLAAVDVTLYREGTTMYNEAVATIKRHGGL